MRQPSMPDTPPTVPCPTCRTPVVWQPENTYRPFCSRRCKLIDLGQWADEQYTMPAEPDFAESDHER